jgi:hypothetical protein
MTTGCSASSRSSSGCRRRGGLLGRKVGGHGGLLLAVAGPDWRLRRRPAAHAWRQGRTDQRRPGCPFAVLSRPRWPASYR